jgi:hypothetical protein
MHSCFQTATHDSMYSMQLNSSMYHFRLSEPEIVIVIIILLQLEWW